MGAAFAQVDTASDCTPAAFCSGASITGVTMRGRKALEDGTFGTSAATVTLGVPNGDTQWAGIVFEMLPGADFTTWAAGTWTVPLNITTPNEDVEWVATYICRVNSSCTNLSTIGSNTADAFPLSGGVLSMNVTGAAVVSPASTDKIIAVLVFSSPVQSSSQFGFTPDQDIASPIDRPPAPAVVAFQETGTAAVCGANSHCSGATQATVVKARIASVGGTGSNSNLLVTLPAPNGQQKWAGVMFELVPGASYSSWAAGDYVVRLNITATATAGTQWQETYICRINSSCTNLSTIGSLTGQTIDINSTGVKTMTVSGAAVASPASTDKIWIVLIFGGNGAGTSFNFRSNQIIDAPIASGASLPILRRRRAA